MTSSVPYRITYAANLMTVTLKSSWAWVKALLHSVSDEPDADAGAHASGSGGGVCSTPNMERHVLMVCVAYSSPRNITVAAKKH